MNLYRNLTFTLLILVGALIIVTDNIIDQRDKLSNDKLLLELKVDSIAHALDSTRIVLGVYHTSIKPMRTSMLIPLGDEGDEIYIQLDSTCMQLASESLPFYWHGTITDGILALATLTGGEPDYYELHLMDLMALSASGESLYVE